MLISVKVMVRYLKEGDGEGATLERRRIARWIAGIGPVTGCSEETRKFFEDRVLWIREVMDNLFGKQ